MSTFIAKIKYGTRTTWSAFVTALKTVAWGDVEPGTYARIVLQILALVNLGLTIFGVNPIAYSESAAYTLVSFIVTVIITVGNAYKNNSTSAEAITSDKIMNLLKGIDLNATDQLISNITSLVNSYVDEKRAAEEAKAAEEAAANAEETSEEETTEEETEP